MGERYGIPFPRRCPCANQNGGNFIVKGQETVFVGVEKGLKVKFFEKGKEKALQSVGSWIQVSCCLQGTPEKKKKLLAKKSVSG